MTEKVCFLCSRVCDKVCSYCQKVSYCNEKHFNYHRNNDTCHPFKVIDQVRNCKKKRKKIFEKIIFRLVKARAWWQYVILEQAKWFLQISQSFSLHIPEVKLSVSNVPRRFKDPSHICAKDVDFPCVIRLVLQEIFTALNALCWLKQILRLK